MAKETKHKKIAPLQPSSVQATDKHLQPTGAVATTNGKVLVAVIDLQGNEVSEFQTTQKQFDKTYAKQPDKFKVKKN